MVTDGQTCVESLADVTHASKPVVVPVRWLRLLRRLMGLPSGRYVIVLSVSTDHCDWSVTDAGRVER